MATNVKTDERFAVKVIRFDKQQSITRGAMMLEIEYSRMKIFMTTQTLLRATIEILTEYLKWMEIAWESCIT